MLPMRLTVVSKPASSNSRPSGSSSAGVSWSPSLASSWLTMSSPGSRRRWSSTCDHTRLSWRSASISRATCATDCGPARALPMVAPYRAKAALLASGTPRRSVITAIGNGEARPATRSHGPSAGCASRRSSITCSIRGAISRDGVRGEGGGDEPAQPGVVGRVQLQQRHPALTPVERTLGLDAEPPVPENLATHAVGRGLEADHRAGHQLAAPTDLVVDGVRVPATLGEVQPRVRVPAEPPVPGDRGAHHDELTRQGHDSVHGSSQVGAARRPRLPGQYPRRPGPGSWKPSRLPS